MDPLVASSKAIIEQGSKSFAAASKLFEQLTRQTEAGMAGEATTDAVFAAFQRVYLESGMPARYPLDLLHGFEMDVDDFAYRSFDDTLVYCYHVAGVVGAMMKRALNRSGGGTL